MPESGQHPTGPTRERTKAFPKKPLTPAPGRSEEEARQHEWMPQLYAVGLRAYAERVNGPSGVGEFLETMSPAVKRDRFDLQYGYITAVDLWLDPEKVRPPVRIPRGTSAEERVQLGEQWAQEHPEEALEWFRRVRYVRISLGQATIRQQLMRRKTEQEWQKTLKKWRSPRGRLAYAVDEST